MLVLALDTATRYLVLGLPHAELSIRLERRHGEAIVGWVDAFLSQNRLWPGDIDAVAAGQGPGSYTGVRVGLAFAQGLARSLGVPLVGVDTLMAIAARKRGRVAPAITARNGLRYAGLYEVGGTIEVLKPPAKLEAKAYAELPGCHLVDLPPSGMALARIAIENLRRGERGIIPSYL